MEMKKVTMVVMNTLHTDARVQRAALAIQDICDLTLIGVGKDCGEQLFRQVLLEITNSNGIIRYFNYIRKVKNYLKNNDFQLFYAHDYYSAALVPWVKKTFSDKKVVYDAHELIFPAKGFMTSKRDSFFRFFERLAIKYADLVICASNERAELMAEYYKMKQKPLVIENISQLPIVLNDETNKLLEKAGQVFDEQKCVLVYAGVLSAGRRIDNVIDIVSERKDTSLLIIGDGPDCGRLRKMASERIPERHHFTGSLPYKYMGVLLEKCDIGYISYPTDTLNNTYCASNKIYEYASVELPMIATDNPTIQHFFDEYAIGAIDKDLGKAFDVVKDHLKTYKNNCVLFTKSHQWNEKAHQLKNEIKNML